MQNKNRVKQPIKTLIVSGDDILAKNVVSLLDEEFYRCVGVVKEIIHLYSYLELEQLDLIIIEVKTIDISVIKVLANEDFLEIPLLIIAETIDNSIHDLVVKHPKSLLLSTPIHEYSFKSLLNLLINAYPPKLTRYVEVFNRNQQTIKIPFEEILFIHADGNYTFINTTNHKVFVRKKTLKKFKEELDTMFIQINKSQIINTSFIKRVELGRGVLVLDNKEIKIGRAFRFELKEFLQKS